MQYEQKLIAALCCAALLVPVAGAEDYISKDAPFYEALMQAAEQSEQIAIGDYGPEAETDFETKRDAYLSGFESGVEYSYDSDVVDTPYSKGYNEGYERGLSDNQGEGYDEGYEQGYKDGYSERTTTPAIPRRIAISSTAARCIPPSRSRFVRSGAGTEKASQNLNHRSYRIAGVRRARHSGAARTDRQQTKEVR